MPADTITVLYVDDEPDLLEIGAIFLERSGSMAVTRAESARMALRLLAESSFDVIVSDYQMPETDGIAFLKTIRRDSNIPFILFTGRGREEVVIEAINSGVDFYLQKGGDPTSQFAELSHKIRLAVDRSRANLALRDSERRLADLINFLPDATFAIDRHGKVIAWNRAIEQMTGVAAATILGRGEYEYALPFYGERRPILLDLVLKEHPEAEGKYPVIQKKDQRLISEIFIPLLNGGKGAYLWFIASPLYDNRGDIIGAIESIRDITDRKKAEDALRAAEDKLSTIFRSSPDIITISELETGRFLDVNDAAIRIFGFERDEFPGKSALDMGIWINPDDRAALIDRIRSEGRVDRFETRQRRKNGEVFVAAISAGTITLGGKRYLISTIRDISELKRTEQALRDSEERYRNVVEGQTEFISRFTPDGIHVFANDAYLRYFGMTREELIGHRFVPAIPAEDANRVRRHFASLNRENPSATIEHRIVMPDGTIRWQQWSDSTIFDEEGTLVEYQSVGRDITSRKLAEEQVQASEERYRSLTEASPDLIFVIDADDRVSYVNTAAARMLGVSREQVSGIPRERLFPPAVSWHQRTQIDTVFATHKPVHSEGPLSFGGREYHFDHYLVPINDPDGRTTAVLGISRDISERRRMEQALQESERKYRDVIENLQDVFYRVDNDGTITMASPSVAEMFGYGSVDEIIGMNLGRDFYYDPSRRAVFLDAIGKTGSVKNYEAVLRKKDGTPIIVSTSAHLCRNESGAIVAIEGITKDITGLKQTEEALKKSEEKFRTILDTTSEWIWDIDVSGRLTYTNAACGQILGYQPDELLDRDGFTLVHPEDRDRILSLFRTAVEEKKGWRNVVVRWRHRDGTYRCLESNATPVFDGHGALAGFRGADRDITGRVQAEQALKESEEKYRALVESSFDGIVIHQNGSVVYANRTAVRLVGGTAPDQVIGKPVLSFIHPEYRAVVASRVAAAPTTVQPVIHEKFLRIDGGIIDVDVATTPCVWEGRPAGHVVFRDVTDRIRAEEALRQSESRLSSIIRVAPIGIGVVSSRIIQTANDRLCSMTGYTAGDLIGQSARILYATDEDYEYVGQEKYAQIAKAGSGSVETRWRKKDGTLIDILLSSTPIDPADLSLGVTFTALDISGLRQATHDLEVRNEEISAALEELTAREQELKKSCEDLARFDEEMRQLTDSLPDIIYRADTSGNIVYMNRKGLELLEVPKQDMINQPFLPNLHPDDIPAGMAVYERVITTGEPVYNFECRLVARRGRGRAFPVIQNVSAVRSGDGAIVGTQGIAIDISDRKRAEDALKESEVRMRRILEQVPGTLWTTDAGLVFTSSYGAALKTMGLEPDQVVGRFLDAFYEGQPDKDQAIHAHRRALAGETVTYDARYGDRAFIARIEPLRDPDLTVTGTLGIAYDVTEMQRTQEKIRLSEELHRSLVSASPDGICIASREGIIAYASPRAVQLFGGSSPEEAVGTSIFTWLAAGERERAENDLDRIMAGRPISATAYRALRRDGSEFTVEMSVAVIQNASGGISGMVVCLRDITDRIVAQESLRLVNTKLNLLSMITRHDILNKLTIIQGFLAILNETEDPEQKKACIARINTAAGVINNLLLFTRDYQTMGEKAPVWIDAGTAFARQLEQFDCTRITVNNRMDGVQVHADPLFEKVLYNLIDNALRYGRTLTTLTASCFEENGSLVCRIEDDGVGIPAGEKDRIFERGVGNGTGLGLFLAKEILAVTGMTIRETGEPGKGARFEIQVPAGRYRLP